MCCLFFFLHSQQYKNRWKVDKGFLLRTKCESLDQNVTANKKHYLKQQLRNKIKKWMFLNWRTTLIRNRFLYLK